MKKFHFVYNILALVRIQMVCSLKLGDLKWKEKILQFTTIIKKVLCGMYKQQIPKKVTPRSVYCAWDEIPRLEEAAADRRIVEATTGLLRRARPPSVDRTGMVHCVSTTGWLMTAKKAGPEILVSLSDSIISHSNRSREGPKRERERE